MQIPAEQHPCGQDCAEQTVGVVVGSGVVVVSVVVSVVVEPDVEPDVVELATFDAPTILNSVYVPVPPRPVCWHTSTA